MFYAVLWQNFFPSNGKLSGRLCFLFGLELISWSSVFKQVIYNNAYFCQSLSLSMKFCQSSTFRKICCMHFCLQRWTANRQMKYEGGFQGRTNKLVDGCYSFWQGGAFPLIHMIISLQGKQTGASFSKLTMSLVNNSFNFQA